MWQLRYFIKSPRLSFGMQMNEFVKTLHFLKTISLRGNHWVMKNKYKLISFKNLKLFIFMYWYITKFYWAFQVVCAVQIRERKLAEFPNNPFSLLKYLRLIKLPYHYNINGFFLPQLSSHLPVITIPPKA